MSKSTDLHVAREEVLRRLHEKYDSHSDFLRNLPTIYYVDEAGVSHMASPNVAIREVQHFTEVGQQIIKALT